MILFPKLSRSDTENVIGIPAVQIQEVTFQKEFAADALPGFTRKNNDRSKSVLLNKYSLAIVSLAA
jgi:hypothetical protein